MRRMFSPKQITQMLLSGPSSNDLSQYVRPIQIYPPVGAVMKVRLRLTFSIRTQENGTNSMTENNFDLWSL